MNIVVVGSINADLVVRVERIPAPGETVLARSLERGGGGKGANQAVAAARAAGAHVTFVGAVGLDEAGRELRAALEADGVETATVLDVDVPTGTALVTVADDGENAIVVVPGANGALTSLTQAQQAAIGAADVLLMQLEVPIPLLVEASSIRRRGTVFVLNAAPSAPLPTELISRVDILVVNEHEAIDLAHTDDLRSAMDVLGAQVGALVVTLGANGSEVWLSGECTVVPPIPVDVVDTTGAGDTFCGVLGARVAGGDDIVTAARWGTAAAALAVQRPGAQSAVPTMVEVRSLLARVEGAGL